MKRALIIGIAGQDGYYLTRLLLDKGYAVYGTDRSMSFLSSEKKIALAGAAEIELSQPGVLAKYVRQTKPHEIY